MVVHDTVCDVEVTYPVKFTYLVSLHKSLHDLTPVLTYLGSFNHPILFHYPEKSSTQKSTYLQKK